MPTLTADPATEYTESPHRTVWQTIDSRFSLELALLPRDAHNALLWDSRRPIEEKLRFSAVGYSVPDAIYKLKRSIAASPFATDEERTAAERIKVPSHG